MNIQYLDISKITNIDFYLNKYSIDKSKLGKQSFALEIRDIFQTHKIIFNALLKSNLKYFFHLSGDNQESVFILGNHSELLNVFNSRNLSGEDDCFKKIEAVIENYLNNDKKKIKIQNNIYNFSSLYVMGIINVTPDSFSDGGRYFSHQPAVNKAIEMIDSGVDIVDIGGESTRPGAEEINTNTEIERVLPIIKEIISVRQNAVISVDTTKSRVAALAIEAGASIINDVSAFAYDKEMVDVASSFNVPYILMHMKGKPKTMQSNPFYNDVVSEIYDFLFEKIEILKSKGVEKIIVDPGIGFGKRVIDNLELINRLSEFKGLGFPILIGVSRKSFIGKILNLEVDRRDIPTIIEETLAAANGAAFIRTHNTYNAMKLKKLFNYKNQMEMIAQ